MTTPSSLDGINVANQVGDRYVRRRELLNEALVPAEPRQGRSIAAFRQQLSGVLRNRGEWIVIDFAAGHDGYPFIQQPRQLPQNTAFGLASEAQEDEVMAREQRVHDLRKNRILVSDDARK